MFALKSTDRGFSDNFYQDLTGAVLRSLRGELAAGITPEIAWREVGRVWTALHIVTSKIATMPFEIEKGGSVVTTNKEYNSIMRGWQSRLEATALTYLIKDRAYWYLATDASGRQVTPVLLETDAVYPVDNMAKITGFHYTGRQENPVTKQPIPRDIGTDRMIWFWPKNDNGNPLRPGVGPVYAALANAGIVRAMDILLAGYMNRGGVPVTLFKVPPGQDGNILTEFKSWLKKISGLKNAFKYEAVRHDVDTIALGHNLKDMEADGIYKTHSNRILEPLHINPSIVDSDAATNATSANDWVKLYDLGIVPYFELFASAINDRIFMDGGSDARIVPKTNRIEAYQQALLAQGLTVAQVTGQPPMTLAEGRETLELPPLEGVPEVVQFNGAQVTSMLEVVSSVGRGDISPEQGAALMGAAFPSLSSKQISAMTTPPEKQQPEAPATTTPPAPPQQQTEQAQEPQMDNAQAGADDVMKALADWRKDALFNLKTGKGAGYYVPSRSAFVIERATVKRIHSELAECKTASDIRAVFDKHWPKTHKSMPPAQVLALLERAVNLAEAQKQ